RVASPAWPRFIRSAPSWRPAARLSWCSRLRYILTFKPFDRARMFKIGLTGGIGSGKSRVADFFQEWGAAVIDTDAIAHELTQRGGAAMAAIREQFGAAMIAADGSLN